jgi:hypothetical protein
MFGERHSLYHLHPNHNLRFENASKLQRLELDCPFLHNLEARVVVTLRAVLVV